ncbi:MAG: hypothetical protein ACYS8W_07410 [Planctomycetota bacterium]
MRSITGTLAPVVVVFLIIVAWREGCRKIPKLAGMLALFAFGVILPVIPVVYWYSANAGKLRLMPTAGERNFFFGHNRFATGKFNQYSREDFNNEKDYEYWNRGGNREAWDFMKNNPAEEVKLSIKKVMYLFHRAEYVLLHPNYVVPELKKYRGILIAFAFPFQLGFIFLVIFAVPAFIRRDGNILLSLSKISVIIWVLMHVVFVAMSRYRYPVLVFIIILAISTLCRYIRDDRHPPLRDGNHAG